MWKILVKIGGEREGGKQKNYYTEQMPSTFSVSINMAFEDRLLGSVARDVRGPSPKGVILSYDTANQRALKFISNKPLRDNRQEEDARAVVSAGSGRVPFSRGGSSEPPGKSRIRASKRVRAHVNDHADVQPKTF